MDTIADKFPPMNWSRDLAGAVVLCLQEPERASQEAALKTRCAGLAVCGRGRGKPDRAPFQTCRFSGGSNVGWKAALGPGRSQAGNVRKLNDSRYLATHGLVGIFSNAIWGQERHGKQTLMNLTPGHCNPQ